MTGNADFTEITMILCFSGTGNSRYIARRIAEALQDETINLNEKIKANDNVSVAGNALKDVR